jgi:hypothetical protein
MRRSILLCVGGVWSNASHQVRWVFTKCQRAHRETALTGHIVSIPQPSGPTMADGRPVSLDTLPEIFQIVFVGAGSLLADLQRQLIARAGIDALLGVVGWRWRHPSSVRASHAYGSTLEPRGLGGQGTSQRGLLSCAGQTAALSRQPLASVWMSVDDPHSSTLSQNHSSAGTRFSEIYLQEQQNNRILACVWAENQPSTV